MSGSGINTCWMTDLTWNLEKLTWISMAAFCFAGNASVVHLSRHASSEILELHCNNCHLKINYLSEAGFQATSFQKQKGESWQVCLQGKRGLARLPGKHTSIYPIRYPLRQSQGALDGHGTPASDVCQWFSKKGEKTRIGVGVWAQGGRKRMGLGI